MKWLAFDLEIAKITSFDQDLDDQRPLGITCAATWASNANMPLLWCGRDQYGQIAPAMNPNEVSNMLNYLQLAIYQGYTLLTFNGAGFDIKTMAETADREVCKSLALSHVDMYFHLFCLFGYGPGLDRAAKGMGLAGKTEGVDGAFAPELWQRGEYGKVLQYVAQDALMTLRLAEAVEQACQLRWTSKAGKPTAARVPRWLTVTEALELPLPDTSWMTKAWTREKFIGWASS